MIGAEEYKKLLDTEEGKKYIEECRAILELDKKKQRELVNTDNYIRWLEKFTKIYPTFNDNDWLYTPEEISEEDNENVDLLCKFYRAIGQYAGANYIYPTPCDHGGYYSISYNGKVYEIGLVVGQGAINFCNTEDVNKNAMIIPFEEIANPTGETRIRAAQIENQLGRIDDLFKQLYTGKLQIPIDAIINRANKVLEELQKHKR